MELFYAIIAVLALASIIFLVLWVRERSKTQKIGNELLTANTNLQNLESSFASQSERLVAQTEALNAERRAREAEQMARVKAETELAAEQRLMAEKMRSQEEVEQTMREQFKALAGDVLGEQSRRFKEENRESMDLILKPFKDNITEFRTRVESIFTHQNEQSGVLKNELQRLMELNVQITTETTNLTNALRGNSKVQGDWGEAYLETILESTGLVKGIHYHIQQNIKGEEGQNLRPDVVLSLPEERSIVIDSKVSLTAYVNSSQAETEIERKTALAAHIASMRQHIKELGSKRYQQLVQSPDFVIMFVPNEPAFLQALQEDHSIWNDAYDKKVIISSPTNLFALLKIVDDLWRRDDQNKNQENIIKYGVALYEQLVAFTSALEGVGTGLDQARAKYEEAYKRLFTGNNNIVRTGERLRKLGLPTSRRQSQRILEECEAKEAEQLLGQQNSDNDE